MVKRDVDKQMQRKANHWRRAIAIFASILLLQLLLVQGVSLGDTETKTRKSAEYPATAKKVVEAFCLEDFNGSQTSSETWLKIQQYTTWPYGPLWDTAIVVKNFKILEDKLSSESAEVKVQYEIVGEFGGHPPALNEQPNTKIAVFKLIREGNKWKIDEPQDYPHISIETAIKHLQMTVKYYKENPALLADKEEKADLEGAKKVIKILEKYRKAAEHK